MSMAAISYQRLGDTIEVMAPVPLSIGVIADTHVPKRARAVPEAALAALAGSDLILHAGDLVELTVLEPLRAIALVVAVAGNSDRPPAAQELPLRAVIEAGPWRIGLVHGHGNAGTTMERARAAFTGVHVVVFGHTHQALCVQDGDVLLFNPGSPTDCRRGQACSVGRLLVTDAGITGTIVEL
jgi:putative phosphoesterase